MKVTFPAIEVTMKVAPGTGRISGPIQLSPLYRVTEWYGDPSVGSLSYDEFVVSESSGVAEVIDWINERYRSCSGNGPGDFLHSTELWILSPSRNDGDSAVQTLIGTFFANEMSKPLVGTHSVCDQEISALAESDISRVDPTSWQQALSYEFGESELTVRSIAINAAVQEDIQYSLEISERESDQLFRLTRTALENGDARRF